VQHRIRDHETEQAIGRASDLRVSRMNGGACQFLQQPCALCVAELDQEQQDGMAVVRRMRLRPNERVERSGAACSLQCFRYGRFSGRT
jgi:hypothetical protein